jgi:hypothetical protein
MELLLRGCQYWSPDVNVRLFQLSVALDGWRWTDQLHSTNDNNMIISADTANLLSGDLVRLGPSGILDTRLNMSAH